MTIVKGHITSAKTVSMGIIIPALIDDHVRHLHGHCLYRQVVDYLNGILRTTVIGRKSGIEISAMTTLSIKNGIRVAIACP
ncbi:hypothetical protein D2E26_0562 [Bifidobacterium dolichotidis]|uniref:Uncharacterized protein n=1 Tax=Bifidobacterium dolichotidis TaxID=2306976 RepID=A0A430FT14_9BIFI|nr:hypothetical protein D2E26_0562 [Bifidobacterium dolichotidis]